MVKASPRLLTFSALIFFFAGNILVLRSAFSKSSSVSSSGGSVASSSSASTSASDQEHLLLAESAIRQLRSEATTNALLGRPAVAWEDPSYPGSSGGSSRSLSQRNSVLRRSCQVKTPPSRNVLLTPEGPGEL